MLDVGSGTLHRLTQIGFDFKTLDAVVLTHFHIDHCSDFLTLCQTLWLEGYSRQLKVYGPPMLPDWIRGLLMHSFPYLQDKVGMEYRLLDSNPITVGNIQLMNKPGCHGSIDARALRLEVDGKTFAYSSDTAPCDNVKDLADGVDLLAHECNWLDGEHPKEVHSSPSEVAGVVEEAQPAAVILTHVSPEVVAQKKTVIDIVSRNTDSLVEIGEDLIVVEI